VNNDESTLDEVDDDDALEAATTAAAGAALALSVSATHVGVRADKALVELLADAGHTVTRAELQRWLEAGLALRDGLRLDRKTPLREGDRITVTLGAGATTDAVPDASVVYEVVHEDEHLIVVNKPPGLVVHPARGHRGGTLVHGLLARGGFERASADPRDPEGHLRPGIVHRLDKDTSRREGWADARGPENALRAARHRARVRRRRGRSDPVGALRHPARAPPAAPPALHLTARPDARGGAAGRDARRGAPLARRRPRDAPLVHARDRSNAPDPRAPRR